MSALGNPITILSLCEPTTGAEAHLALDTHGVGHHRIALTAHHGIPRRTDA